MRTRLTRFFAGCCLLAASALAHAQSPKPGLWETTSNMTWQQSPMPSGMTMPGSGNHTSQACVTQEEIDKFEAFVPQQQQNRSCQMANLVKSASGMTTDMVCTGPMSGTAKIQVTWTDDSHATGSMHFVGAMQMGGNSKPLEWTITYASLFKNSDCGNIKPRPLPAEK